MSKVTDKARQTVMPILESLGYELVDIEYVCEHKNWYLNIYIDAPGGITIDDCEKVSKALDLPLDEADPTDGRSYILGVSSPGLDRPLKTERDFARNIGKAVQAKLYAQIDGKKLFTGILAGYDGSTLKLETENGTVEIAVKDIALVKPYIEFE